MTDGSGSIGHSRAITLPLPERRQADDDIDPMAKRMAISVDEAFDPRRLEQHYALTHETVINTTYQILMDPSSMYWRVDAMSGNLYVALSIVTVPRTPSLPIPAPHISLVYNGIRKPGVSLQTLHSTLMRIKYELPTCIMPARVTNYGNGSHFLVEKTSMLVHLCRSVRAQVLEEAVTDACNVCYHITWQPVG
jgi:hypothetical protein